MLVFYRTSGVSPASNGPSQLLDAAVIDFRDRLCSSLISDVHYLLIQKAIRDGAESEWVDRLLLSSIFHSSKDESHERAMHSLTHTFTREPHSKL